MKLKAFAIIAVSLSAILQGAESDPVPTMPTEVTLTSGRVLRNVSVVRWETGRVVLKHAAGADPIAFALFKKPAPEELSAIRAASLEAKGKAAADPGGAMPEPGMVSYSGRMVVTSEGVETKAPAGTTIYIRDPRTGKPSKGGVWSELGMVLLTISTDREGKFSFKCPKGRPFVIQASFMRHGSGRDVTNAYEWRIPSEKITDPQMVWLTEGNASKSTTPFTWK